MKFDKEEFSVRKLIVKDMEQYNDIDLEKIEALPAYFEAPPPISAEEKAFWQRVNRKLTLQGTLNDFDEKLDMARNGDLGAICLLAELLTTFAHTGFICLCDRSPQLINGGRRNVDEKTKQEMLAQAFEMKKILAEKRNLVHDHTQLGTLYLKGIGCVPDLDRAKICLKNAEARFDEDKGEDKDKEDINIELLRFFIERKEKQQRPAGPRPPQI